MRQFHLQSHNRSRRQFIASAAAVGTITLLPFDGRADGHGFKTENGEVLVHPISHASMILETPMGVIYVDTVGDPALYAGKPPPDLLLVTHRHGDHYNGDTLSALTGVNGAEAPIVTNADVLERMPDSLKDRTTVIGHEKSMDWNGVSISAIPAYNLDPNRQKFHPRERGDNGYVLVIDGFKIYISGDTEDIPEMRALEGVDLAFVCMNLPFTMNATSAASAVAEFKPTFVYPYHYRGKDGGTQDPKIFAAAVGSDSEVKLVDWYPDNPDV